MQTALLKLSNLTDYLLQAERQKEVNHSGEKGDRQTYGDNQHGVANNFRPRGPGYFFEFSLGRDKIIHNFIVFPAHILGDLWFLKSPLRACEYNILYYFKIGK